MLTHRSRYCIYLSHLSPNLSLHYIHFTQLLNNTMRIDAHIIFHQISKIPTPNCRSNGIHLVQISLLTRFIPLTGPSLFPLLVVAYLALASVREVCSHYFSAFVVALGCDVLDRCYVRSVFAIMVSGLHAPGIICL